MYTLGTSFIDENSRAEETPFFLGKKSNLICTCTYASQYRFFFKFRLNFVTTDNDCIAYSTAKEKRKLVTFKLFKYFMCSTPEFCLHKK